MVSKHNKVKLDSKINHDSTVKMLRNPDDALWRQVKAQAALDGVTQTEWVEEAIRIRLAQKSNSKKTPS